MSQIPPGQQPQYPQGFPQQPPGTPYPQYPQGYGQQQGYPQQYAPYSPYQMPQVHPMAYAQGQMQGMGGQFSRAGMMLIVTGILMGLCGVGCGAMAAMPLEQMMAEAPMDPQLAALMTPQMMKIALIGVAAGSLIYAALAIIFGVMVRKQSRGATIAGIVLTSLVLAYLALNMLGGVVQMAKMGPQGMIGMCVMVVPLVVAVWQLIWLIGALRSGGQLRAMQNQMQMQYWQMMAMQQAQQQQQYQRMMQQQAAPAQNSESGIQNPKSEKKDGGEGQG